MIAVVLQTPFPTPQCVSPTENEKNHTHPITTPSPTSYSSCNPHLLTILPSLDENSDLYWNVGWTAQIVYNFRIITVLATLCLPQLFVEASEHKRGYRSGHSSAVLNVPLSTDGNRCGCPRICDPIPIPKSSTALDLVARSSGNRRGAHSGWRSEKLVINTLVTYLGCSTNS